jgi:cell wall-associated NlpC family hydrolase
MIQLNAMPQLRLIKLNRLLKISVLALAISSFFYANLSWSAEKKPTHAVKSVHKKITLKKPTKKQHHNEAHHQHSTKKSTTKPKNSKRLAISSSEPAYLKKPALAAPIPATIPEPIPATIPTPEPKPRVGFVASVEKHLVNFVSNTVSTLHYSDYKLGGKKFDPIRGVYVVDCSNFVDHILQSVSPHAYTSLVNAAGSESPASQHYYDFFSELASSTDGYWNKVNFVDELRPGDILVFRYKNSRGRETGGHVMVVMDKPLRDTNVYYVRVADSAPSRHSQDTRQRNEAGIGIGTLLLKVNPQTGRPAAYAWGVGSYWNNNVKVAMARPLDVDLA